MHIWRKSDRNDQIWIILHDQVYFCGIYSVTIGNEIRSFVKMKNTFVHCHSNKQYEINWKSCTYMEVKRTRKDQEGQSWLQDYLFCCQRKSCLSLCWPLTLAAQRSPSAWKSQSCLQKEEAYTQIKSQAIRTFSMSALEEADRRTLSTTRGQASTSLQRSLVAATASLQFTPELRCIRSWTTC